MNKRQVVVEDICKIKFVSDPRFSTCGKAIAYTVTEADVDKNGYQSNIWVVDQEKNARQLTFSPKGKETLVKNTSPRWSPDGRYMAFISNRNGKNQLFVLPSTGGEARPVCDMSAGSITWAPNSKYIAFVAKDPKEKEEVKNPDKMHFTTLRYKFNGMGYFTDSRKKYIWMVDVESGEVKQLTKSPFDDAAPAWSPDSQTLAFVSARHEDETNLFTDVWIKDIASGDLRKLTTNDGPSNQPLWSPDGKIIAFVGHDQGDANAPNDDIFVIDVATGETKNLTKAFDRSVTRGPGSDARYGSANGGAKWKLDGSGLYFKAGHHGASILCFVNMDGKVDVLTQEKHGIAGFDVFQDGKEIAISYVAETTTAPGEIYLWAKGTHQRLSAMNDALMNELELTVPEKFIYKSAEDWDIDGWIMKPVGFEEGKKYPVVVQIHGGPASAYGWSFYHEFHMLCSMGYGVLYVNPRGSRTYGEKFAYGVIGDWGGHDYDDIMNGVAYATENFDWIDSERIGVTGGSYGGYMTNWIVTQTDRFKAAVSLRSISNLYTKYGVSDIGWYGNRRGMAGADLWDGPEKGVGEDFIMSRSAMRYAPNAKTPLLLIHSHEDYRCPFDQAEQFYVALKRLGNCPVEMVVFKRENHELSRSGRPWNRMDRLRAIADWFERYL